MFKPTNTAPATKSDSVIDTIVLITESFFVFRKRLGDYVLRIAEGALAFREMIGKTKKGHSLRKIGCNPKAIVSIVSKQIILHNEKRASFGSVPGSGHISVRFTSCMILTPIAKPRLSAVLSVYQLL